MNERIDNIIGELESSWKDLDSMDQGNSVECAKQRIDRAIAKLKVFRLELIRDEIRRQSQQIKIMEEREEELNKAMIIKQKEIDKNA